MQMCGCVWVIGRAVCVHGSTNVCVCVCMCVCMGVCVCVHILTLVS